MRENTGHCSSIALSNSNVLEAWLAFFDNSIDGRHFHRYDSAVTNCRPHVVLMNVTKVEPQTKDSSIEPFCSCLYCETFDELERDVFVRPIERIVDHRYHK